jgi:hypothetical protein
MKFLKRIFFFLSLFVLYIIFKEALQIYVLLYSVHTILGYGFLFFSAGFFIYFVMFPILKILAIPKSFAPVKDVDKEQLLIRERIENFKKNRYLQKIGFDFSFIQTDKESYLKIIKELEKETNRLRKVHVSQMFYSTSIAQNGFLDALLILSGSINHIKEIFLLFNGRVSNRDLLIIAKKVYYSMAIGGSEGIEYASEEIFSKFATTTMKSIPFLDKIMSSLADGLVNAMLLTRISFITENYCKLTYIQSDKDLVPSAEFIISSARSIVTDILDRILNTLRKIAFEKSANAALIAINPLGYVLGKMIDSVDEESLAAEKKLSLKEYSKLVGNPLAYGVEKVYKSLKKRKNNELGDRKIFPIINN